MDKLKDWEILSYRNPNCFTDIKGADIIDANGKDIHTYIASTRQYPIHSVKRLSDGVVFTKMERDGNGFLITGFKVIGSEMEVELDYGSQKKRLSNLTPPTPTEQTKSDVLFTTEDGVDMYEDTKYWKLDHYNIQECVGANYTLYKDMYKDEPDDSKRFSTKELAEQYIIDNKPCLSIQEVLKFVDAACHPSEENFREYELRDYVKQKLNKQIKQ